MKVLITGGCGFIGCNTAARLKSLGWQVTLFDNLSRPGVKHNLAWLCGRGEFEFVNADVRDWRLVTEVIRNGQFHVLIHLAAQVAVTKSVEDPRQDFEINALGTLNLLEAVRLHSPRTVVLNASTNKVYGKLGNPAVRELETRYEFIDLRHGINEDQFLDFHSPYGCSKGAADQYVRDYARIYGLRTVNLRQSCVYGYHQFGVEDQGWLAWLAIAQLLGRPVTIYGSGKQVRDVLFIDDLVDCYLAAVERIDGISGMSFNIGGGPENTLSLLELLNLLEQLSGRPVAHTFGEWRPGDQLVYISDVRRARSLLHWQPQVDVGTGVRELYKWLTPNLALVAALTKVLTNQ